MSDKFNGVVKVELVVDNYNYGDVFEAVMQKLHELDFVVASTISKGDDDE